MTAANRAHDMEPLISDLQGFIHALMFLGAARNVEDGISLALQAIAATMQEKLHEVDLLREAIVNPLNVPAGALVGGKADRS